MAKGGGRMLDLDFTKLSGGEQFETLCARLARRIYPGTTALSYAAWDGGRDVVCCSVSPSGELVHEVVWQAKFTEDLGSNTKQSILKSIEKLMSLNGVVVKEWILCIPVDPTGVFFDWLHSVTPTDWHVSIWGRTELSALLEEHSDIMEAFFYPIFEDVRRLFLTEKLELLRVQLDPSCQWEQRDPAALRFVSLNVHSPDLVLDLVVRNVGVIDAVIFGLEAEVSDWQLKLHGLPKEGLLFPKITYRISIGGGGAGKYSSSCDPPLVIGAGGVERFKIRISDTGYAWNGVLRLALDMGNGIIFKLPGCFIYT